MLRSNVEINDDKEREERLPHTFHGNHSYGDHGTGHLVKNSMAANDYIMVMVVLKTCIVNKKENYICYSSSIQLSLSHVA